MGRNWAITIGINDYYNLQTLNCAVQDAESVRDFFLQEVGFEGVYTFSDHSPPIETPRGFMRSLPTFGNLKRFLRERFQQPFLNRADTLWFFFAGHGELHNGQDYLMPIDVDPGNINETALRISDITASLKNCGADNVVLLLDACRSQSRRSGLGVGREEQPGLVSIYACSPRESSYELEGLGHGAFTYALLEGLRLQGVQNCATVERLDQYLRYQVPQLNQRHGKPRQTPYTVVEPLSKNHLILLPHQATLLADVQALKVAAYEAESERDYVTAEQLWIRVLAASPADQQAIRAIQRLARIPTKGQGLEVVTPPAEAIGRRDASYLSPESQGVISSVREPVQPDATTPTPAKPAISTFDFEVVTITGIDKGLFGRGTPKVTLERRRGKAPYRVETLGNHVALELVAIPGGSFQIGSPSTEADRLESEGPQHTVTLPPFLISKYPVTQAQWQAVASLPQSSRELKAEPSHFKGANRPVEQVSWHDAVEFCERLSRKTGREYRLPSEAEWEYACRAGTTTPFHFGETITTDLANYRGTDWAYEGKTYPGFYGQGPRGEYRERTTDVSSFPPNAFGLYDMHGNIWEWCTDHWHDNYQGAPTDGSAWVTDGNDKYRLLRGGSWDDSPRGCRSAFRGRIVPASRYGNVGFRVVCASAWTL